MSKNSIRLTSWKHVCISVQKIDQESIHIAWIKEIEFDCFSQKDAIEYYPAKQSRFGKPRTAEQGFKLVATKTRSQNDKKLSGERLGNEYWLRRTGSYNYCRSPRLIMLCKTHLLFTVYVALYGDVIVSIQITCSLSIVTIKYCRTKIIDWGDRLGRSWFPRHIPNNYLIMWLNARYQTDNFYIYQRTGFVLAKGGLWNYCSRNKNFVNHHPEDSFNSLKLHPWQLFMVNWYK